MLRWSLLLFIKSSAIGCNYGITQGNVLLKKQALRTDTCCLISVCCRWSQKACLPYSRRDNNSIVSYSIGPVIMRSGSSNQQILRSEKHKLKTQYISNKSRTKRVSIWKMRSGNPATFNMLTPRHGWNKSPASLTHF